jgi:hydroxymethylpyrimidine/phosphomethylpyrimidine kinase
MLPRALTIAGSDPSGGAGIQADLKTFTVFGVYGMSVITALTAQNTCGVSGVHVVPAAFVRRQIDAVVSDIGVDAVKTGMLPTAAVVRAVAGAVRKHRLAPLVVDPVMIAGSGAALCDEDARLTLLRELIPLATLVTPNTHEAAALTGVAIRSEGDMRAAARALVERGARAVLVKGGHLGAGDGKAAPGESNFATAASSDPTGSRRAEPMVRGPASGGDAIDILDDGHEVRELRAPRLPAPHTHGTGCQLSAAITAGLAQGLALLAAVERAKQFITVAIRDGLPIGHGSGPANALAWVGSKG